MALVHNAVDASGQYRVQVEDHRFHGRVVYYTVRVIDEVKRTDTVDDEIYHSDADAACEGWAVVSLLLASKRSHLQGAYIIGASEY